MNFLKCFIEDMKYYDSSDKELNEIIKNTEPKGKNILDIGAGTGRLSFLLPKYAERLTAIEPDKGLIKKIKNVLFFSHIFRTSYIGGFSQSRI